MFAPTSGRRESSRGGWRACGQHPIAADDGLAVEFQMLVIAVTKSRPVCAERLWWAPKRSRPRGDIWGFIPALAVPLRTDELASAAQPLFVTIVHKFLSASNKFAAVRLPAAEPA
jgi:hypothetical protein